MASDEAAAAGHNGDIWPRPPTKYGTILAVKKQMVLWKNSIMSPSACRARPDAEGAAYVRLGALRRVDSEVLRAVLVAAAVVDFSGVDAYGLGKFLAFRHGDALLYEFSVQCMRRRRVLLRRPCADGENAV